MQLLPKWVLPPTLPAIYDLESATALEMTAKVYGAMQTLIGEYNAFADSVNTALGTFTETETEARKEFETSMTIVYRQFTCQMENYLRLNLDSTATKVIQEGMNGGTITVPTDGTLKRENYPADAAATGAEIEKNAMNLANEIAVERARINNLVANPGTATEGNAELIDIRTGHDGTQYPTAGEAVRTQTGKVSTGLDEISSDEIVTDNLFDNIFDESGYIDPSTGASAAADGYQRTSKYYPIPQGVTELNLYQESGSTGVTVIFYNNAKQHTGYNGFSGSAVSATVPVPGTSGFFRLYKQSKYTGKVYVGYKAFSGDYTYTKHRTVTMEGLSENVKLSFVNAVAVNNGNLFDNNFGQSGYIVPGTGADAESDGYVRTGNYYKVEKGTLYFVASENVSQVTALFYDTEKNYLKYYSFSGTEGQCIVDQDGFFRLYRDKTITADCYFSNFAPDDPVDYTYKISTLPHPVKKRPVIVNFGDSIIGNTQNYTSVSAQLSRLANATVYNCGFGGCRMSVHTGNWDLYSMYRLADCIYNGDFSQLVTAADAGFSGRPDYFRWTARALNECINFDEVDIITISYGTNDYREEVSKLDNANNLYDTTTVCGALRYAIKRIQSRYPRIKILVTTPIFRTFLDEENGNAVVSNSDTKNWGSGTLLDYAAAIKAACEQMKVPCLDLQNESQMNEFTRLYYFPADDGTHPNEKGRKEIAALMSGKIKSILG